MKASNPQRLTQQKGIVLLILASLLIVVGVSSYLLVANNARMQITHQQTIDLKTKEALARAKNALLGFAATSYDAYDTRHFGLLPCPDVDEGTSLPEGAAHGTCGSKNVNAIGRLPWRTLGIDAPKDGANECLWYAVSGYYKSASSTSRTDMLNEDIHGLFRIFAHDSSNAPPQLAGNPAKNAATRAVAVIIAPGSALNGQDRSNLANNVDICGGNYIASNYLDTDTNSGKSNNSVSTSANTIDEFIGASQMNLQDTFNDTLAYITADEIFAIIRQRSDYQNIVALTNKLAVCLKNYAENNYNPNPTTPSVSEVDVNDHRFPWPAPLILADYRDTNLYIDSNTLTPFNGLYIGHFPSTLNLSFAQYNEALVPMDATIKPIKNTAVPQNFVQNCLTATDLVDWAHWKDHFFYAVIDKYAPDQTSGSTASTCDLSTCFKVNEAENVVAMVWFSNSALPFESRNAPPPVEDTDTKQNINNYLEYDLINRVYTSRAESNDKIVCIQKNSGSNILLDPIDCS